jgi:hypothetical protein
MGQEEWQQEAESVISSAEEEHIRVALLARLAERHAARDGVLRIGPGTEIDYKTRPLTELGVNLQDAQSLKAFQYLRELKQRASREHFTWTRQYLDRRFQVYYRGSRSRSAFLDSLIRGTVVRRHLARRRAKSSR